MEYGRDMKSLYRLKDSSRKPLPCLVAHKEFDAKVAAN